MTRLTLPVLMLCATALGACVEGDTSMPTVDACGAALMGDLVGQNRSVLATMKFAGPVRIIEPGMAVTMDYIETRLNIELDEAGKITRVYCG